MNRLAKILALVFLVMAGKAGAVISFVGKNSAVNASNVSYTATSGPLNVLVVALVDTSTTETSSVTWGGSSLTKITGTTAIAGLVNPTSVWYLKNPSAVASNVSMNANTTATFSVVEWAGVDQSNPFPNFTVTDSATSPISTTITTGFDTSQEISVVSAAVALPTTGSSFTTRTTGGTATNLTMADKATTTVGQYNSYWSGGTTTLLFQALIEMKAAVITRYVCPSPCVGTLLDTATCASANGCTSSTSIGGVNAALTNGARVDIVTLDGVNGKVVENVTWGNNNASKLNGINSAAWQGNNNTPLSINNGVNQQVTVTGIAFSLTNGSGTVVNITGLGTSGYFYFLDNTITVSNTLTNANTLGFRINTNLVNAGQVVAKYNLFKGDNLTQANSNSSGAFVYNVAQQVSGCVDVERNIIYGKNWFTGFTNENITATAIAGAFRIYNNTVGGVNTAFNMGTMTAACDLENNLIMKSGQNATINFPGNFCTKSQGTVAESLTYTTCGTNMFIASPTDVNNSNSFDYYPRGWAAWINGGVADGSTPDYFGNAAPQGTTINAGAIEYAPTIYTPTNTPTATPTWTPTASPTWTPTVTPTPCPTSMPPSYDPSQQMDKTRSANTLMTPTPTRLTWIAKDIQ